MNLNENRSNTQKETTPSPDGGRESELYHSILHEYFGFDEFRGIQLQIIESIGSGRDTLGLMPTGGGKSITFQVPALAQEGLCLVISPLIALMKDQVTHLRERGIKAMCIHAGMSHDDVITALENCIFGNYKFLYVSPERLSSELFLAKLRHMHVCFITVDEAHCISQWGYDFRPSYLAIAQVREVLPHAPMLALTATATPAVVKDIQQQLHFNRENVCQMSFERKNLAYCVRRIQLTKAQEVLAVLNEIPGSAIVYTRSRAASREIAEWLEHQGVLATFFHAGLSTHEKNERQAAWQKGFVRVMVATNAFGMGIDKADVRAVIHADVPDSPEAYFQEAGRAGRDGLLAHAVLLFDDHSVATLKRRVEETFPPVEYVTQVYEDMCCFLQMAMGDGYGVTREFALEEFCRSFRHYPVRAYNALLLLMRAGYIEWTDAEDVRSRILMSCQRDELYDYHFAPNTERVLWHLLRSCTGIFSEYVFIEEDEIARAIGLTRDEVCENLIELSRMHVIRYIPRRAIPHITFLQRRVEREEIVLRKTIYEDRKRELQERIQTMIGYLHTEECRSRFLLRYFGETDAPECGVCDNCQPGSLAQMLVGESPAPYEAVLTPELFQEVRSRLLELLQQGPQQIATLSLDGVPTRIVAEVVHRMLQEEEICCDSQLPIISLPKDATPAAN